MLIPATLFCLFYKIKARVPKEMNCPTCESLHLGQGCISQLPSAKLPSITEVLILTTVGTIYSIFQVCLDNHIFSLVLNTAAKKLQD